MTVSNLNYTGRKRINRSDVDITLQIADGDPSSFSFNANFALSSYNLPDDALLTIEAYRQTTRMRFDFGEIGTLQPPPDRNLAEFDTHEGVQFRVCITSQDEPVGVLLAAADRIPLTNPSKEKDKRAPLLPVRSGDIGSQIYQIDFSGSGPGLVINSELNIDWHSLVLTDAFASLAYPTIVREIFLRILLFEEYSEGDPDDWQSLWLLFALDMPGIEEPPYNDEDQLTIWIDEVVDTFCRQSHLIKRFSSYWIQEAG